jgi:nicotinamide-nucleotide amidase
MSDLVTDPGRAARVVTALQVRGQTLATAESLTGGLVAATVTAVPGASAVMLGGVVAYAVATKQALLRVPAAVLAEHGAVSEQTARLMAVGARTSLGSDWAVATTGVAGPEPSEGHPPGTVHVAVHGLLPDGEEVDLHRVLSLHGTRSDIRVATVDHVLDLLLEAVTGG